MDTPTNTPDINQNNNVLPIESILSQPDNNLLKSHFVKVNVVPVPKKDGTTGYVIGNQPRGIASSVTRSGFSLDMRVSKKYGLQMRNKPKQDSTLNLGYGVLNEDLLKKKLIENFS